MTIEAQCGQGAVVPAIAKSREMVRTAMQAGQLNEMDWGSAGLGTGLGCGRSIWARGAGISRGCIGRRELAGSPRSLRRTMSINGLLLEACVGFSSS
jgi:hypothetical protein